MRSNSSLLGELFFYHAVDLKHTFFLLYLMVIILFIVVLFFVRVETNPDPTPSTGDFFDDRHGGGVGAVRFEKSFVRNFQVYKKWP